MSGLFWGGNSWMASLSLCTGQFDIINHFDKLIVLWSFIVIIIFIKMCICWVSFKIWGLKIREFMPINWIPRCAVWKTTGFVYQPVYKCDMIELIEYAVLYLLRVKVGMFLPFHCEWWDWDMASLSGTSLLDILSDIVSKNYYQLLLTLNQNKLMLFWNLWEWCR